MKTCPKALVLLELNRMMPQNQIIFDKLFLALLRTKWCKNHSYMLSWENFIIIIDQNVLKLRLTRV
jgi:hypothetical protein